MMRSTSTKSSVSFGSVETFETEATYQTNRQYPNPRDIEKQTRDLDEALILYGYAERAALRIQQAFRERLHAKDLNKQSSLLLLQKQKLEATREESEDDLKKEKDTDVDEQDYTAMYTMVFLALVFLVTTGSKLAVFCWKWIKRIFGGEDIGDVDAVANAAAKGGGPTGPTPTGGNTGAAGGAQAGAQGAIAAQAASSAASGAASGMASIAAAGK